MGKKREKRKKTKERRDKKETQPSRANTETNRADKRAADGPTPATSVGTRVEQGDGKRKGEQTERMKKSSITNKRWREKNPEKARCHSIVWRELRNGRIVPEPCHICGSTDKVQAHHRDHSKPMDITWLCPYCHRAVHSMQEGKKIWPRDTPKSERERERGKKRNYYRKKPPEEWKKREPSLERLTKSAEAKKMRERGMTYPEIARSFGITKGTAYKWVNDVPYN